MKKIMVIVTLLVLFGCKEKNTIGFRSVTIQKSYVNQCIMVCHPKKLESVHFNVTWDTRKPENEIAISYCICEGGEMFTPGQTFSVPKKIKNEESRL